MMLAAAASSFFPCSAAPLAALFDYLLKKINKKMAHYSDVIRLVLKQ